MSDFSEEVELMARKAAKSDTADAALKFSQAARNAAHALSALRAIRIQEQSEQRALERERTAAEKTSMRRTGRTTRMLEDAMAMARNGRAVYVIGATKHHADMLRGVAGPAADQLGIKFEAARESGLGNMDWETMSLQGAHPNCAVLVDHYAIESKFAAVLEMLHRYDAKPSVTEP